MKSQYPFRVELDGRTWVNIRLEKSRKAFWADPEPNPENESQAFPVEKLAFLLPSYLEWERSVAHNQPSPAQPQSHSSANAEPQQGGSSADAEPQQGSSSKAAGRQQSDSKAAANRERNLQALAKARLAAQPTPYQVMCRWWPIVRWLDSRAGLQTLRQMATFPRPLAREANELFADILQKYPPNTRKERKGVPAWHRSERFYHGLVSQYFAYKDGMQVPIWWLRLELLFEDLIYKHLID